jgi:hypothetical protein
VHLVSDANDLPDEILVDCTGWPQPVSVYTPEVYAQLDAWRDKHGSEPRFQVLRAEYLYDPDVGHDVRVVHEVRIV